MNVKINRTHLSLFVRDPERSAKWYADVLGMVEHARGPQWIMMSFGEKHHDIALIQAEPNAQQGGLGLQHYGMEIEGTFETLQRLHGMLIKKGVEIVKTTDHAVGNGLYFNDPDGNRLEFFLETISDNAEAIKHFHETGAPSNPIEIKPIFE
ncbi:VOC family protein [Acinetobacter baumannii]|uniref:VOC family protein n=1 Tax=Acinetobacter baumannii TaxID=470 RepID=UPI00389224DE